MVRTLILIVAAALSVASLAPAERKPRVLIYSHTAGFRHDSIPLGKQTLTDLAVRAGFEPVVSDDAEHFDPAKLREFKVVVFNNTTGELPLSNERRQALLDFVSAGGGFVGVHAATDTLYEFNGYGVMVGGYFDGHPWNSGDTVTIKNEEPEHPIAKPWGAAPFELTEEIYQFRAPYERSKVRVLLSLDTAKTSLARPGVKRTDGDFPLAWVRRYGDGRVFYTALGHNEAVWRDERFREHLLAGLQYAAKGGEDAPRK